jgi:hypothetical protein
MPRRSFSDKIQADVLVKCRRRCALCFCLKGDDREKRGQLAHIDRNSENDAPENAAFLCSPHHDRYDSTSHQTKRILPDELKEYQQILYASVESFAALARKKQPRSRLGSRVGRRAKVSLEIYDRRVPIYLKTMQFVRDVVGDLNPELKTILQFGTDTDQAVFLFDDSIAEYLDDLFKRAMRLRTLELMRTRMQTNPDEAERFGAVLKENTAVAHWFSEQFEEIRARFTPFLRLT